MTNTETIYAIQISSGVVEIRRGLSLKRRICRFKRNGKVVMRQVLFEGGKVLGYVKRSTFEAMFYDLDLEPDQYVELTMVQWTRLRKYKVGV